MTKRDAVRVLAILQAAYPFAFREIPRDDADSIVRLWTQMFASDSAEAVLAAVQSLIATRTVGYPPTIGEVKAELSKLRHAGDMDAQSAWALAAKAAAGNLAWDKLPEEVQAAIGSPQVLRDWGMIDTETFNTVVYSQFIKAFGVVRKRRNDLEALPEPVRNIALGLSERLALGDGD